jgi:hypothetical protein
MIYLGNVISNVLSPVVDFDTFVFLFGKSLFQISVRRPIILVEIFRVFFVNPCKQKLRHFLN